MCLISVMLLDPPLCALNAELFLTTSSGYSCSDLGNVCKEAAMAPVRDLMATLSESSPSPQHYTLARPREEVILCCRAEPVAMSVRKIRPQDFIQALRVIRPTSTDQQDYADA